MTAIEKLVGNILIGNPDPILKRFSYSDEIFKKEKNEILEKMKQRNDTTKSQIKEQRKFISKLETIAHKLSNEFSTTINPYNMFKSLPNMVIAYDHKFKVLDFNQSFLDCFCNSESCNSCIFNIIDNLEKENVKKEKINIYNKDVEYESEYICNFNNNKFKVYTTPVYDDMNKFDYFVRIYTKIN